MTVTDRPDLKPVEHLLGRPLAYSRQFRQWNLETWPRLKNGEDFDNIWDLPGEQRIVLERVYVSVHAPRFLSEKGDRQPDPVVI